MATKTKNPPIIVEPLTTDRVSQYVTEQLAKQVEQWLSENPNAEKLEKAKLSLAGIFGDTQLDEAIAALEAKFDSEASAEVIRQNIANGILHFAQNYKLPLSYKQEASSRRQSSKATGGGSRNRRTAEQRDSDRLVILNALPSPPNDGLSVKSLTEMLPAQANLLQDLQQMRKEGIVEMNGSKRNATWRKL